MRKALKITYVFVLSILILVIIAFGIIHTPLFKGWLKNKLVHAAESQLNADISIESITGNLVSGFTVNELSVNQQADSLFFAKSISADYRLFDLLRKKITIGQLILDKPQLKLVRENSGMWNINQLVKHNSSQKKSADSSGTQWMIEARSIQFKSGSVDIFGLDTSGVRIPKRIKNIELNSSLSYSKNKFAASLQDLNFDTRSPDFNPPGIILI
ncbi:MAG: AsmA family protein [Calditrichaceae bacterium]